MNKPRKRATIALALSFVAVLVVGAFVVTRQSSHSARKAQLGGPPTSTGAGFSSATVSHGVYIANFFAPVDPTLLSNENVDGSSQAYKWSALERNKGVFRWTRMDSDLKTAQRLGKRIALGIDTGAFTPGWAKPQALTFVVSSHNGKFARGTTDSIPIPWDATYEANVRDVANAVADHLRATGLYGVVSQVKLTGINEDSEETRMPTEGRIPIAYLDGKPVTNTFTTDATSVWRAHGYTRALVENAWETMAGYWATAFPDKTLALPTILNAGFPNIDANGAVLSGKETGTNAQTSQYLVDYAVRRWGKRFMSMHTSLSDLYTAANQWLQVRAYSEGASIGYQFNDLLFGQVSTTPETRFLTGANIGLRFHMSYVEVFRTDPRLYPTTMAKLHAALN